MKKNSKWFNYIVIYLFLFLCSGFPISGMKGTNVLVCMLALCGFVVLFKTGKNNMVGGKLLYLLLMIFLITLTTFVKNDEFKQTFITLTYLCTAYVFAGCFEFEEYAESYTDVMTFLCVYSLVVYAVYTIAPGIIELFPTIVNSVSNAAYNVGFCYIYKIGNILRNQGIFWEPGAFQFYIIYAMIFSMFVCKKNTLKRNALYIITIISTVSTTGYLTVFMVICVYLLSDIHSDDTKKRNNAIFMLCATIIAICVVLYFFEKDRNLYYQIFGKIESYFDTSVKNTYDVSSASVRFDAITKVIQIFLKNPIFGVGTSGLVKEAEFYGFNLYTCTWANWFAMYGVFYGLIMISGLYKSTKMFNVGKMQRFLIFLCLIVCITSEEFSNNPSFLIYTFMSYSYKNINHVQGELLNENSTNQLM